MSLLLAGIVVWLGFGLFVWRWGVKEYPAPLAYRERAVAWRACDHCGITDSVAYCLKHALYLCPPCTIDHYPSESRPLLQECPDCGTALETLGAPAACVMLSRSECALMRDRASQPTLDVLA